MYIKELGETSRKHVLLLHGWTPKGHTSWVSVAEQLEAEGFDPILIDMPGFGQSESPDEVWGAQEYAHYLDDWIQNSDYTFDCIIGHSFGGAVASQLAVRFPEKYKKIVLVAPAIVRKPAPAKKYSPSNPLLSPFKAVYRRIFGSKDYNQSKGIMRDIMKRVVHEDLTETLRKITSKTLIVWGTEDTYTPYQYAQGVADGIKNSTLKTYEGINHGIHLHAADRLVKDIKTFLES